MRKAFSWFNRLVCGWKPFLTRRNVQRACSAVVFDEFISHGKLFYRGHKTCNFFNAIYHKKDFWKKGKRFCRDISIQWILMNITLEIWSGTERKTFPMYANFALPSDANLSSNLLLPSNLPFVWRHSYFVFHCCQATLRTPSTIHIYIYIYINIFFARIRAA